MLVAFIILYWIFALMGNDCLACAAGVTYKGIELAIGHIRILGIGLVLAWNGGSCGGISLKRD